MASLQRGRKSYDVKSSVICTKRLLGPEEEQDHLIHRASHVSQETLSAWKQMPLCSRAALVRPRRMLCFYTSLLFSCKHAKSQLLPQKSRSESVGKQPRWWKLPLNGTQPPPLQFLQRKGPHPKFGRYGGCCSSLYILHFLVCVSFFGWGGAGALIREPISCQWTSTHRW